MLVPRYLSRCLVQVFLHAGNWRALTKCSPVSASSAHIANLSDDSLAWQVVGSTSQADFMLLWRHMLWKEVKPTLHAAETCSRILLRSGSGGMGHRTVHEFALAGMLHLHTPTCRRICISWVPNLALVKYWDTVLNYLGLVKLLLVILVSNACRF